jgi:hypothetical protein
MMKYVTKAEVYDLQDKFGVPQHSHINGLMSCPDCVSLVVHGKTSKQVWDEIFEKMRKDLEHE